MADCEGTCVTREKNLGMGLKDLSGGVYWSDKCFRKHIPERENNEVK